MKALALDFDGVLSDSAREAFAVALRTLAALAPARAPRGRGRAARPGRQRTRALRGVPRPHAARQPRRGLRRRPRVDRGRRRPARPGVVRRLLRRAGGAVPARASTAASTRSAARGRRATASGWLRSPPALRAAARAPAPARRRGRLRDRDRKGRGDGRPAPRRLRRRRPLRPAPRPRQGDRAREAGPPPALAAAPRPRARRDHVRRRQAEPPGGGAAARACGWRSPAGATTASASGPRAGALGIPAPSLADAEAVLFGPTAAPRRAAGTCAKLASHVSRSRLPHARRAHAEPEQHQVGARRADRARRHRRAASRGRSGPRRLAPGRAALRRSAA